MPIIYLIVGLAAVGFVLWVVNEKVKMSEQVKTAINWIVVILLVFWLLNVMGLWNMLLSIKV